MIPDELVSAIERFAAAARVVVASDYDGVLSPIVDDPAAALPDAAAVAAFLEVAHCRRVTPVVISGRSRDALVGFLGDLPGVQLVGNHGADLGGPGSPDSAVERIIRELTALAADHPGCHVEPKPYGAAFHYRRATDREGARDAARAVAGGLPGRTVEGKEVIEVVLGDTTKGTAIERIRNETAAEAVLYVGDDVTDEDVFRSLEDHDLGIKVGPGETAASHRIESVGDVAEVFRVLDRALASGDDLDG